MATTPHTYPRAALRPAAAVSAGASVTRDIPMVKRVETWVVLVIFIFLVARQAPYIAGPSRDAQSYIQGRGAADSASYHFMLFPMLAIQTGFFLMAWKSILSTLKRNPLIIAGLVVVLGSVLWTRNVGNTLRMGLSLADNTLFIIYFLVTMSTQKFMRLLMFVGVAASLLSIFFVVALPAYGIFAGYAGGAWQGICSHKNTLGGSSAYLLTPVFFVKGLSRLRRVSYAAFLLFMIVMSQSRGAWMYTIALLLFVGVLALLQRVRRHERWVLVITGITVVALGVSAMVAFFDVIAPMMGKDATMTGRTEIYSGVWGAIRDSPWVGYGYGSFWDFTPEAARIRLSLNWPGLAYAESGFLELGSQLGLLGMSVVALMFLTSLYNAAAILAKHRDDRDTQWYLSIIFLALTTQIDAGWLLSTINLDWPLIVMATMGLAERRRMFRVEDARAMPSVALLQRA